MVAAWMMMAALAAKPVACDPARMAPALDQAVATTLTSVRRLDAAALLAQMSPSGVAFGQGEVVPMAVLKADFSHRSGHYCDLFVCKGKAGPMMHLFTGGKTDKSVDARHGRASVVLNGNSQNELDLSYAWSVQCQWQLTAMGGI